MAASKTLVLDVCLTVDLDSGLITWHLVDRIGPASATFVEGGLGSLHDVVSDLSQLLKQEIGSAIRRWDGRSG